MVIELRPRIGGGICNICLIVQDEYEARHASFSCCREVGEPLATQRRWMGRQTSINTNKRTVLGPKRINAGVQPLNKNLGPSFLRDSLRISNAPSPPDCGETLSDSSDKQKQFECLRGPSPAILSHQ